MARLNGTQISRQMKTVRGWKRNGNAIFRVVRKKDLVQAMGFVQSVAMLAERMDHHPDIDIRWNTITLVLSTHSEGGLTAKDFTLAQQINTLK
jgi:4a-hydroxytetrahydrobiopterin dehydratase